MKKILIINQYSGNKGDRAVLFSLCQLILKIEPNSKIIVSTSSPELWENYDYYDSKNIKFIPQAWDYVRVPDSFKIYFKILQYFKKYTYTIIRENFRYFKLPISRLIANPFFIKAVKNSDLVLSTGGHHYTTLLSRDVVSSLPFDLCIAQMQSSKTFLFSQSFGPFAFFNKRNEYFIRSLLNKCNAIYYREEFSKIELELFGVNKTRTIPVPESVFSLSSLIGEYIIPSKRDRKVGVAIYSTVIRSKSDHNRYIGNIADICNYFIRNDYEILFFPMELKGTKPDDRKLINDIVTKIEYPERCAIVEEDLDTETHLFEVSKCRYFIGHKTHSIVYALTTGTPIIAIEYHPKTNEFMKLFNLTNFSIKESELDVNTVIEKIQNLDEVKDNVGLSCISISKQLGLTIEKVMTNILTK